MKTEASPDQARASTAVKPESSALPDSSIQEPASGPPQQSTNPPIQPSTPAQSTHPQIHSSNPLRRRRKRVGHVACCPKAVRDRINQMLDDGMSYPGILKQLGPDAKGISTRAIMSWNKGGYQDYLRQQHILQECRSRQEVTLGLLRDSSRLSGFQATQQLASAQICAAVADFGPETLREALTANPLNYFRMLNTFARLTTGGLKCERYLTEEADRPQHVPKSVERRKILQRPIDGNKRSWGTPVHPLQQVWNGVCSDMSYSVCCRRVVVRTITGLRVPSQPRTQSPPLIHRLRLITMNLLGFNISIKRSASSSAPALQRSLSPDVTAWLAGENPPPRGAYLHNALEQVPWVYRSVMAIAEQVANIPFLFSRGERGRETLITSGPLHDLYARPNPQMNRFQYWEYRILWLLLRGECFRVPIYESSSLAAPKSDEPGSPLFSRRSRITGELTAFGISLRQPDSEMSGGTAHQIKNQKPKIKNGLKSILFLEPDSMTQIIDNHEIIGWRYNGAKSGPVESQVFLPEEVWYDRLPNPFDPWRGLPPLLPANNAAHTDFAASAFMRGLIENNADNGLIVRADHQLTDEQRAQITAALKNRKGSAGSPDRTILLWGATDIVKPSLSSADLQFLENRKFSRSEICAAFGVPEEIVATSDHNKYDVMQGARLNFIENRIAPLCARLEAEEQRIIQAIDPDAVGWFDIDSLPIMQEARRSRLAAAKLGFDMGIPFNELNKNFDLGFKELPWGNNGYLPSSLTKPQ